ncbi:large subunit ribosomal protein L9 [Candidatus Kinetoplastibacterium blastocrithidii TCC012E]|uniref:Large ribosomal subunit protein bL9 n=1 Tax=Candidatus Kinetoplastidibacterium blastocrithidiae TCC012E TaxID=1208922 RepID=M1MDK2_9PROT|nr:50S ribosomal protein L9 [Candidatus Kinetoplastibacterium blastocrithidii]AFZ83678.1 large subunit ribosomal protein L9 [Candidatus Kinetoplastibacterium blastocrithidii (ex Strigomonas culicis)]AGF49800.1 large subunit ribosomal protein L9 [Candidatus Kinetoplastibacterium blastocrithidii TCC012E]
MEVILLDKVSNLGNLGDVVRVKNGYARNFLIPNKIAKRATKETIKEFENKRSELEKSQLKKLNDAKELADKLDGFVIKISQKASVDGKLFGSVSNIDILHNLKKSGFSSIEKSQIYLSDNHIKTIGEFVARIKLHSDVEKEISIIVIREEL